MGVFKRLTITSWSSVYNRLFSDTMSWSWCKTFLVTGDAGAVSELAALCEKRKQECLAPRLYMHKRIRKLLSQSLQCNVGTDGTSERISFTEFITSLCLLTKKAFMNGNKKSSDSLLNGHLKPRRVVAVQ